MKYQILFIGYNKVITFLLDIMFWKKRKKQCLKLRGRAFAHGAKGRRIDPLWGGPIELFHVPASAPRLV